ncbi:MAG: hypothetical protein U1C74_17995 [Phenylobacterium sp.]|nr:hypothetical protein [Phenylobacterium sp.]
MAYSEAGPRTLTPSDRHPKSDPESPGQGLRTVALLVLGVLMALPVLALAVTVALTLVLFGPAEGADRLQSDWRRIWLAHAVDRGQVTPQAAYLELYGDRIGPSPRPQDVRRWLADDLEAGEPIVWDVILARYLVDRFGAVDGRSVPPGVYVAAGPIGPDAWPGPILTHYLMFPRHGYVLVVPTPEGGRARPAVEASASLRRDFSPGGDGNDLFAVVEVYRPGAFDFPTAGEPVHDLFLLSADPRDIEAVAGRIRTAARRLDRAELGYGLFSRNSNSALRCFLRVAGLSPRTVDAVRARPVAQLRLPGIGQDLWKSDERNGIPECSAG